MRLYVDAATSRFPATPRAVPHDHPHSVYDNEAGELERGEGETRVDGTCHRHHRRQRGGSAGPGRRRSPGSLPGALSPAAGTHLPRWELAGTPLARRRGRDAARAGAVEDARYRRLARRGSALVHPRRGAGGARRAAGRGRAGGGRRHRLDDSQPACPHRHLLPPAWGAAKDRRHRARLPLRRLRPAEPHPPPRRRSPARPRSRSLPRRAHDRRGRRDCRTWR